MPCHGWYTERFCVVGFSFSVASFAESKRHNARPDPFERIVTPLLIAPALLSLPVS